MIVTRRLAINDKSELEKLILSTEEHLDNKQFWMPLTSDESNIFFDDDNTYMLGTYDEDINRLVCCAGLFFNEQDLYVKRFIGMGVILNGTIYFRYLYILCSDVFTEI